MSWLARRTTAGTEVLGWLAFGDEPKPTAKAAIGELRRLGIRTTMISGDNAGAAAHIARQLGLEDYEANVLPRDKAKRVEALKKDGRIVAMVGDGINDAPALAAADVGIAMGSGTDVAMHAAGITLLRSDPRLVARRHRDLARDGAQDPAEPVLGLHLQRDRHPAGRVRTADADLAGAAMAFSSVSVRQQRVAAEALPCPLRPRKGPILRARSSKDSLGWAFIHSVIGIPLAAFGLLTPIFAGAAMAFSSVSVVSNALLLKRYRSSSN